MLNEIFIVWPMPAHEMPPYVLRIMIFLSLILFLVGVQIIVSLRIGRQLKYLKKRIDSIQDNPSPRDHQTSPAEITADGAFEAFLGEDASRRALPKAEQFSAFRKWRQERGMNWSNS